MAKAVSLLVCKTQQRDADGSEPAASFAFRVPRVHYPHLLRNEPGLKPDRICRGRYPILRRLPLRVGFKPFKMESRVRAVGIQA